MKKVAAKKKESVKKQGAAKANLKPKATATQKKLSEIESVHFTLGSWQDEVVDSTSRKPKGVLLPGLTDHLLRSGSRSEGTRSSQLRLAAGGLGARGVGDRNIIGDDDRQRVTDSNLLPYPWICYLDFRSKLGVPMIGTGWLIGPRTVVTAGHCIYSRVEFDDQGNHVGIGEMKQYRVSAGINGELNEALAVTTVVEMATTNQWIQYGMTAYDFGVLYLDRSMEDEGITGQFSVGILEPGEEGTLVCVVGYPWDKQSPNNGSMWADVNRVVSINDQQLSHEADTLGGDSGAPVIYADGQGNFIAVGIHNYGGDSANFATRINQQVANQLEAWIR